MQSLRTALKILAEFSHVSGELTVTELASRLEMCKSQVSRMLATFREEGWIVQNPRTRGFSIGIAAYAAGARFVNSNRLTSEALPVLRSVVDRCGFTATLCVLDGTKPLYLLGIDGSISVDFASRIGSYFPFHATAPGKLLVAFADDAIRASMLNMVLATLTPRTIVDTTLLKRELRGVRDRGFAVSTSERTPGIGGIAVPIFGADENFIGALGIAYPARLVEESAVVHYAAILHEAASKLSMRVGAEGYPFLAEQTLLLQHPVLAS